MKRCPRCDRSFPDSETFCEADGTALVKTGPTFSESAGSPAGAAGGGSPIASDQSGPIECPGCGGQAQPGGLNLKFFGGRVCVGSPGPPDTPPPPAASPPPTST